MAPAGGEEGWLVQINCPAPRHAPAQGAIAVTPHMGNLRLNRLRIADRMCDYPDAAGFFEAFRSSLISASTSRTAVRSR